MISHMLASKHMTDHQKSGSQRARTLPGEAWIEDLVRTLGEILDSPSDRFPTPHCLTRSALIAAIQEARQNLARQRRTSSTTAREVRRHLENEGLVHGLPLAAAPGGRRLPEIFALDIGASSAPSPDPVEMLQAAVPSGVVCYFSALVFHGLTTQPCPHHHIARLVPPSTPRSSVAHAPGKERTPHDPLGTPLFMHDGLLFYVTNRDPALLPGIQTRLLHPHARIRIADYEQTLLDTLHKPASCGGPAVVFEAWETGAGRLDEARLFERLHRISRPLLSRRTGWMLQRFGHLPGAALEAWLREARQQADREGETARAPLLPGVPGRVFDSQWRLDVP